jgi:ligand-binding sensor domain-containing protein
LIKKLRDIAFIVLMVLLSANFVAAQQFNFKHFSVDNGLEQSQVLTMIEDNRGYIWMGTWGGGLCRYDGIEFASYNNSDGLVNNFILSIYEDSETNLWVGTKNGLSKYNGLVFETIPFNNGTRMVIGDIVEDNNGIIWLGTNNGLFTYDGKTMTNYSKQNGFYEDNISCVYKSKDGTIWAGHDQGFSKITGTTFQHFTKKEGLSNRRVRDIAETADGQMLIATYGGGLNVFDNGNFWNLDEQYELKHRIIHSIKVDSKGVVWMATNDDGVCCWNPNDSTLFYLTEKEGLSNNHVSTIIEDSWGFHWFGTSGGGVSKYLGQQFVHYKAGNGLPTDYVFAVHEDRNNDIWVSTTGKGVSRMGKDGIEHFTSDSIYMNKKVKAIFEDKMGNMWFGSEGEGLTKYDGKRFRNYNRKNGLGENWIKDIVQGRDSVFWVATAGKGITKMTPRDTSYTQFDFQYFNERDGMIKQRINNLHEDKMGRIWFGTDGGIIGYILNDEVTQYTQKDGLTDNTVRSLVEDNAGVLWAGTAGSGVVKIDLYKDFISLDFLNNEDGLSSNNIYLLELDRRGNLWVGSNKGLDRVRFDPERTVTDIKHYGIAEGFVGIETNTNASCQSKDGSIWFGTIKGLTKYTPKANVKNTIPPKTRIYNVSLFYKSLRESKTYGDLVGSWGQIKEKMVFPYNHNHLSFDFIGTNHRNPKSVEYRWKLKGSERDWSPLSKRTSATYSNLPPGNYTFLVEARNEDKVWTKQPSEISFTIQPPFWETWWFRTLYISAGILLLLLIFLFQYNRLKRKARVERQRLEMEKDLIKLEQKALRLQMNPHFIFNALNSIQGLITVRDDKTARYFLAKFSKLMRMILENSRQVSIPMEEEVKTIENYLELEKFSSGDKFEYSVQISDNIDPEAIAIPPMMIQPFTENSIIHGLKHLEDRKGEIKVEFEIIDDYLECRIIDNGIGRKKATEIKAQKENYHKSTALVVTQERLGILNKELTVKGLEIIDRKGDEGESIGTMVVLRVPVMEAEF